MSEQILMGEQIMVLKNDNGEDIYSIDKAIISKFREAAGGIPAQTYTENTVFITPLKSSIDILEPLTIYNRDTKIGTINMCEILLGAISDLVDVLYDKKSEEAYEKDENESDALKRIWEPTPVDINPELNSFRTTLTVKYKPMDCI